MVRGNGDNPIGGEGVPEGLLSSPRARERASAKTQQLIDRARELPDAIGDLNERFVGFVREKPMVAIGVACAAGYVLGRVLRRVV
jgi:ElaB/YqjD/DUF883 family membrane-anchored ribosome-binding protein